MSIAPDVVALLQCPITGLDVHLEQDMLVSRDGARRYRITASGIPLFGEAWLSRDGAVQRDHYDVLAPTYLTNLSYPHTREYMAYLDRALLDSLPSDSLGTVAEICCGAGEGLHLLGARARLGVGVDVSTQMLESACREAGRDPTRAFVQGDATRLPLRSAAFDTVVMFGGIHHVNDRQALFAEVARVLRPGGLFLWREPADDYLLWRAIRAVVYRTTSALQADTEHPIRLRDTEAGVTAAGMTLATWRTFGFVAYCFLMNSDVLPINRLWQYVPGIRPLTRAAARVDDWTLRLPGLRRAGLIAIGSAIKGRSRPAASVEPPVA
jgi:SAM-dependent methyltransferase